MLTDGKRHSLQSRYRGIEGLQCRQMLPSLFRHKTPRIAPVLFQQGDAGHAHAPVQGFAHVVNGEQGDIHVNLQKIALALGMKPSQWLEAAGH